MSDHPNDKPVQRYTMSALMDFSNKAKSWCVKCKLVFLASDSKCPECGSNGEPFIDTRFMPVDEKGKR